MIECPVCNSETKVVRTDGAERRRRCTRCLHRFTTVEQEKDTVTKVQRALSRMREVASKVLSFD